MQSKKAKYKHLGNSRYRHIVTGWVIQLHRYSVDVWGGDKYNQRVVGKEQKQEWCLEIDGELIPICKLRLYHEERHGAYCHIVRPTIKTRKGIFEAFDKMIKYGLHRVGVNGWWRMLPKGSWRENGTQTDSVLYGWTVSRGVLGLPVHPPMPALDF